jgi:putative toxin-antitoxin system antitoxin component (TIGR02293 family)
MATQSSLQDYIGVSPSSGFAFAEAVEKGMPLDSLDLLRESGLTFTEMGAVIPHRTLKHRKAKGENLTTEETERVLRFAKVLAFAERVFGSREKSLLWLRGKDDRLGDRTALSLLKTEAGGKLVESMLWQISEGMFT